MGPNNSRGIVWAISRDAKVQFSSVRGPIFPNLNLNHLWGPEPEPEPELNLLNRFSRFGSGSELVRTI